MSDIINVKDKNSRKRDRDVKNKNLLLFGVDL